jgi:hypothetical protein
VLAQCFYSLVGHCIVLYFTFFYLFYASSVMQLHIPALKDCAICTSAPSVSVLASTPFSSILCKYVQKKITVFRDMTPYSLVDVYRSLKNPCCLHLQRRRMTWAWSIDTGRAHSGWKKLKRETYRNVNRVYFLNPDYSRCKSLNVPLNLIWNNAYCMQIQWIIKHMTFKLYEDNTAK